MEVLKERCPKAYKIGHLSFFECRQEIASPFSRRAGNDIFYALTHRAWVRA